MHPHFPDPESFPDNLMLHAVIMAGGSGTRFWPASRRDRPKQLLQLWGPHSLIRDTVDRLRGLVPDERQYVITNRRLTAAVAGQLPELPPGNIVGEPCKRDTAPCIGLAAAMVSRIDPDATMVVLPADHVITDPAAFADAVRAAERLVDATPSRLVTFGIRPSYPAESFGYIERGEPLAVPGGAAYRVDRFREKPDRRTAEEYLATGRFYWNSGIFVWRAETILRALAEAEPEMYGHLARIRDAIGGPDEDATLEREFAAIDGKSIDYAVMERYPDVAVIEAPFPWDDVGSWRALSRLHPADPRGNTVIADHVGIDTRDSIIFGGDDHTIVTIGVENLVIVHTDDATLVASAEAEERVREAVQELQRRGHLDRL